MYETSPPHLENLLASRQADLASTLLKHGEAWQPIGALHQRLEWTEGAQCVWGGGGGV